MSKLQALSIPSHLIRLVLLYINYAFLITYYLYSICISTITLCQERGSYCAKDG